MGDKEKDDFFNRVLRQAGKGGPLRLRLERRAAMFVLSHNKSKKIDEPVLFTRGLLRVVECQQQPLQLREEAMASIARMMHRQPEIVQAVHDEGILLCETLASLSVREKMASQKIEDKLHSAISLIAEHCDECTERLMMLLPGLGATIQLRFERMNSEPISSHSDFFFTLKLLNRHFDFFCKRNGAPPWSPKDTSLKSSDTRAPLDIVEFWSQQWDFGASEAFTRALFEEIVNDEEARESLDEEQKTRFHICVLHLAAKFSEKRIFTPKLEREAALFLRRNGQWEVFGSPEVFTGMVRVAFSDEHPLADRESIIDAFSREHHVIHDSSHEEHDKMYELLATFPVCDGAEGSPWMADVARTIIAEQAARCSDCQAKTMTLLHDLGPVMRARFEQTEEPFNDTDLLDGALLLMKMNYDFYCARDGTAPWNAIEVVFFRALYEEMATDHEMMLWVVDGIKRPDNTFSGCIASSVQKSLETGWTRAHFRWWWTTPLLEAIEHRLMHVRAAQPTSDAHECLDLVASLAQYGDCQLFSKLTGLLRSLHCIAFDPELKMDMLLQRHCAKIFFNLLSRAHSLDLKGSMEIFLSWGQNIFSHGQASTPTPLLEALHRHAKKVCMWWESSNTLFGRTRNPYDSRRIAEGSSGGEAALIAAAGSLIGVGSDIGGSIRMPAFFNGVFGLKPTPGVIPLEGHHPEAVGYRKQMLRIGPICRYANDLTLMYKVLGGQRVVDELRIDEPTKMKQLRVFYMDGINTPLVEAASGAMTKTLRRSVRYLELKYDLAAVRIDLPLLHRAIELFVGAMHVEGAPKFHELLSDATDGINIAKEAGKWLIGQSPHTFPALLVALVDAAPKLSDLQYAQLKKMRERLQREISDLLGEDGVLLFPSFAHTAPFHNQPIFTPLNFAFTGIFNAVALPVVQCPMGLGGNGLPLGVQVVGAPNSDRNLIAIAKDLEEGFGGWQQSVF